MLVTPKLANVDFQTAVVFQSVRISRCARAEGLPPMDSPAKIQKFLDDEIGYNQEPDGHTCYSPRRVLREQVAHCMEGALVERWRCGIWVIRHW